ncbi:recombinase family protein [Yoonia sp. R2-816]|uniref:recombinase family protein n=1 Tax=Yoonia sp. R2-816 TaxID=3342638 RepID=UPI003726DCA1
MTHDKPRLLFGYARVSTDDQRLDPQIDALLKYGVERDHILTDRASGKSIARRPGFRNAIKAMRPGAGLVVWKLDRLGRNLSELIQTADLLRERDAQLVSLTEQIDTETASGKLMYHMISMFAQFERDMISERTRAGLAARKAKGKSLGRKSVIEPGSYKWNQVVHLMREGLSFVQIADQLEGVSKSTLYNNADDLRAEVAVLDADTATSDKGTE